MGLDIFHIILDLESDLNIDYLEIEDFKNNPEFLKKYAHLIVDGKIYYSENGYLRKRMNEKFIKAFENNKLYFSIDDAKKAKSYLKARENECQVELEINFQKYFIDNFVEGESIFLINW
jgi:hypothetical protein